MAGAFVSIRACAAQLCAALLTAVMSGCCSISVTHELGEGPHRGSLGGRYRLEGVDAPLAVAMRKHAPNGVVFADDGDASALPLKIDFGAIGVEKGESSALQVLPAALTVLTLPLVLEYHTMYRVRVESPLGIDIVDFKRIRRDAISLLPIGFLPYALSLDGYEYGLDGNIDEEMRMKVVSEGLTNAVAKVVISTLTKSLYDAHMKEIADNARNKKIAEEAALRENVLRMAERGWPQEAKLRDFAIKETTGLWDVIVSLRAEISIRKNRLHKLSDAIKGFGRKPEEDADYIKCKGEYDTARSALAQIFKSLESTYLAASKNDALYDSAEARKRTRKTIDECSRLAIEAQKRVLNRNH